MATTCPPPSRRRRRTRGPRAAPARSGPGRARGIALAPPPRSGPRAAQFAAHSSTTPAEAGHAERSGAPPPRPVDVRPASGGSGGPRCPIRAAQPSHLTSFQRLPSKDTLTVADVWIASALLCIDSLNPARFKYMVASIPCQTGAAPLAWCRRGLRRGDFISLYAKSEGSNAGRRTVGAHGNACDYPPERGRGARRFPVAPPHPMNCNLASDYAHHLRIACRCPYASHHSRCGFSSSLAPPPRPDDGKS